MSLVAGIALLVVGTPNSSYSSVRVGGSLLRGYAVRFVDPASPIVFYNPAIAIFIAVLGDINNAFNKSESLPSLLYPFSIRLSTFDLKS